MDTENNKPDRDIKMNLMIEDDNESVRQQAPTDEITTESGVRPEPEPVDNTAKDADPLGEIRKQIENLSNAFESKLKYDRHKEKIIDDLHQTLQEYRQGFLKKYLQRIFMDIIKIVDDIRKFTDHYNDKQDLDQVSERLLKYLVNTASDLEDLFAWEGVVPFTCEGDQLDPSRQRVVDKVETDDPAMDKKIADRLRPGYEWDGKVIRPEMVSVYVNANHEATKGDEKIR